MILGIDPGQKIFASALVDTTGFLHWSGLYLPEGIKADWAVCEAQHTRGSKRSQVSIYSTAQTAGWLLNACQAEKKGYVQVKDWKQVHAGRRWNVEKLVYCRIIYHLLTEEELENYPGGLPDETTAKLHPEWFDLLDSIGIAKAAAIDPKIVRRVKPRLRDPFKVR